MNEVGMGWRRGIEGTTAQEEHPFWLQSRTGAERESGQEERLG